MHSQLTDRSVVVVRGGLEKSRSQSLRSGANAYHAIRGERPTYDIHYQPNGGFNHKGKQIDKNRLLQSNATIVNALHNKSAGYLSRLSKQFGAKHTGNSHLHRAEMRNHHTRRKVFQKHGIPTIPHWKVQIPGRKSERKVQQAIKKDVAYPVVISPIPDRFSQQSIVAANRSELSEILSRIAKNQDHAYLQEGVQGQVFSGLVMPEFRQQKPYAFPPSKRVHDYKFVNSAENASSYRESCGQDVDKIRQMLLESFKAANLHCLARVDVAKSRAGEWYVLHVEPHPRLDRHSLLADSVDRVGAIMRDVFLQQVECARRR